MNIDQAVERYATVSRVAAGFARGKMRYDPVYKAVIGRLRPGLSLLDVGCGEGYLLALAGTTFQGLQMVGIDHDERRLGVARKALLGLPVRLEVGDVRQAELPPADVVTCLDVLHYQPPEEQDALLSALAQCLRPGGALLVRDGASDAGFRSSITAWSERLAMMLGRHRGDGVYLRPRDDLRAAIAATGLAVDDVDCAEGTAFSNVLYVGHRS